MLLWCDFFKVFFSKSRRIPCILFIPLWLSICSLNRYEDLENEAKELGVASEAEVIILLNKLYPFAVDDITTLPFVQVCSWVDFSSYKKNPLDWWPFGADTKLFEYQAITWSLSLEAWWAVIVNATIFQGILNFMEVYIIVFLWFSSFKIQDGSFSAGNFMRSWSVSKVISQYTRSYETFNLTAGTKWTIRSKWSVCGASLSTLTVNQLFSFQS